KEKVQPVKAEGPVSVAPGSEVQDDDELDEEGQWRKVYADFIAMKRKFGEPTEKLTYEKFKGTLQRNKDALMARHKCTKVRFRVYEKQGRAALKASPVK
ncbi:MAG: MXAN_5187 C-terminal domain-containing protein, partial [Polyangiaceae bacterium]